MYAPPLVRMAEGVWTYYTGTVMPVVYELRETNVLIVEP